MTVLLISLFGLAVGFTIWPHRLNITYDEINGWRCWLERDF